MAAPARPLPVVACGAALAWGAAALALSATAGCNGARTDASATAGSATTAATAVPPQWLLLEDFERDTAWSLDSANDYADLVFTTAASHGQTALEARYQDDGRDKVILRKEVDLDLGAVDACTLDAFCADVPPAVAAATAATAPATGTSASAAAPADVPAIALAFLSHAGTWFETAAVPLHPGWNRDLGFALTADGFKTGTRFAQWQAEARGIDRLMICIIPPAGRGGTIAVDRLMVHAAGPLWRQDAAVISGIAPVSADPVPPHGVAEFGLSADFPAPALLADEGAAPPPLRRMTALVARVQPPSGEAFTMRGFCTARAPGAGGERVTYALRLSPDQPGTWRYQLGIEAGRGTVWAAPGAFVCDGPAEAGAVGVDPGDPRWFSRPAAGAVAAQPAAPATAAAPAAGYDDPDADDAGAAPAGPRAWVYPVGENVAWSGDYEPYVKAIADAGGNWMRTWTCPWNDELTANHRLDAIDLASADHLDRLFAAAEHHGVLVQLCLFYHGSLGGDWGRSPFNKANGGPCTDPRDFWTNPDARAGVKRLLDYAVARWGASPQLFAWELWNEVDFTPRNHDEDILAWHREMAAYLRKIDVHHHLITTSTGAPEDLPGLWRLEDLDLAEVHGYGPDQPRLLDRAQAVARAARMPLFVAECGRGWQARDDQHDHQGRLLRQTRWCGLMRGLPAAPMPWWWDTHIAPNGLLPPFGAIATFLQGEDFRGQDLRPFSTDLGNGITLDALVGATAVYGYVYDPARVAAPQAAPLAPLLAQGARIHLDHLPAGRWTWTIHDTTTGAPTAHGDAVADAHGLDLIPGAQADDFAFTLKPADAAIPPTHP